MIFYHLVWLTRHIHTNRSCAQDCGLPWGKPTIGWGLLNE